MEFCQVGLVPSSLILVLPLFQKGLQFSPHWWCSVGSVRLCTKCMLGFFFTPSGSAPFPGGWVVFFTTIRSVLGTLLRMRVFRWGVSRQGGMGCSGTLAVPSVGQDTASPGCSGYQGFLHTPHPGIQSVGPGTVQHRMEGGGTHWMGTAYPGYQALYTHQTLDISQGFLYPLAPGTHQR